MKTHFIIFGGTQHVIRKLFCEMYLASVHERADERETKEKKNGKVLICLCTERSEGALALSVA